MASATNTGKLSSTDWTTFNNKLSTATAAATYVPYTGATASVNLGVNALSSSVLYADGLGSIAGFLYLKQNTTTSQYLADYSAIGAYSNGYVFNIATPSVSKQALLDLSLITASATRTYTLPDLSGTFAMLEAGTQTFTGTVNVLGSLGTKFGISIEKGNTPSPLSANDIFIYGSSGATNILNFANSLYRTSFSLPTSNQTYTFPAATGTIALTSDLSGYVPTSRTLTINGTAFDLSANRSWSVGTVTSVGLSSATSGVTIGSSPITTSGTITLAIATASASQNGLLSSTNWTTFNNKQNALTNPITGTGTRTINYLPIFSGSDTTIANSSISEGAETGVFVANTLNVQNPLTVTSYVTADAFIPTNSTVPTNGMYRSAANTLAFATNTAPRLTISATGAATFSSSVTANGPANDWGLSIWGSTTTGQSFGGIIRGGTNSSDVAFKVNNAANTIPYFNIRGDGNVGIGTSSPACRLDILGTNEVMNISGTNATSAYTGYYYNTSTLVGYIGNGSSILSGAASSDFIFRSQGALVYAAGGNNERMRITSGGI